MRRQKMATPISSVSPTMKCFLNAYFLCLCLLFSLEKGYALEGRKVAESHHSHSIEVSSLLPSASCKPSTKGYLHKTHYSVSINLYSFWVFTTTTTTTIFSWLCSSSSVGSANITVAKSYTSLLMSHIYHFRAC